MSAFVWAWAWLAAAAPLPRDVGTEDVDVEPTEQVEGAEAEPSEPAEPADTGQASDEPAPAARAEPEPPPLPQTGSPTFLAGDQIEVPKAEGDVFATARIVNITGPLPDNGFLLGQTVEVSEEVQGDVLVMGQSVRIKAPVRGDVYAVGEEIRVDAPIYGTLYTAGNRVMIASDIYGEVEASAREIEMSGVLHSDTSFRFATVKVGDNARVDGNLNYVAPRPSNSFDGITKGDVSFKLGDFDVDVDPTDPLGMLQSLLWWVVGIIRSYVGLIAVGAIMLAFASPFVRGPSKVAAEQPVMSAALGFVAAIVTPVAASIAILLFVTIPLGVIALALYGVGLYIVQLFAASALGHAMNRRFFPSLGTGDFAALATGLVPLVVLSAIPQFVGTVVWLLATFVGFGALWLHWRDEARDRRRSRKK
ncbi:MAG: hypothetical protein AAGA48_14750 [Myxococcota bacterium]